MVVQATRLLKAPEVAELLAISERTLNQITAPNGPLPAIRMSERVLRYDPAAVQSYIDQQRGVQK